MRAARDPERRFEARTREGAELATADEPGVAGTIPSSGHMNVMKMTIDLTDCGGQAAIAARRARRVLSDLESALAATPVDADGVDELATAVRELGEITAALEDGAVRIVAVTSLLAAAS